MADDRVDLIYHEQQTAALCGVHAVNTLLQAPHFSEIEMAQIAHELDAAERELMASGGIDSAEYLQYVAEGSGNVAESGMFSIQVLSRALEVFGLQAVPLSSPAAAAAAADPTSQQAFICNHEEHWLTVRKIHDQWWNLNSVYSSPEPLSSFYLSAFLGTLREQGYTIFVIQGQLPASQPPASLEERAAPGQAGRWFTPEEARAATKERQELKNQGYAKAAAEGLLSKASAGQGTWLTLRRPGAKRALEEGPSGADDAVGDDPELARALAASLADVQDGVGSHQRRTAAGSALVGTAGDDEDADLAAAIAASLADHHQGSALPGGQQQQQQPGNPASPRSVAEVYDDEDPELAAAIAASMRPVQQMAQDPPAQQQQQPDAASGRAGMQLPQLAAEPAAGDEGAIEVAMRLPGSGRRVSRRFVSTADRVGHLAAFAAQQGVDMQACQLALQFPRRVLSDWQQSLAAAGVGDKHLVSVEPKH